MLTLGSWTEQIFTTCSVLCRAWMAELRFALIGEGNTDEALLPVIQWLLRQQMPLVEILGTWANRREAPIPQPRTLAERIALTITGLPYHMVFVHRDADN